MQAAQWLGYEPLVKITLRVAWSGWRLFGQLTFTYKVVRAPSNLSKLYLRSFFHESSGVASQKLHFHEPAPSSLAWPFPHELGMQGPVWSASTYTLFDGITYVIMIPYINFRLLCRKLYVGKLDGVPGRGRAFNQCFKLFVQFRGITT